MVSVWRTNAGPGPYILLDVDVVISDGHNVAQQQNPAITKEFLSEIWSWKMEGATDTEIICRLRQQMVPTGYSYHQWCPGNLVVIVNYCSIYRTRNVLCKHKSRAS